MFYTPAVKPSRPRRKLNEPHDAEDATTRLLKLLEPSAVTIKGVDIPPRLRREASEIMERSPGYAQQMLDDYVAAWKLIEPLSEAIKIVKRYHGTNFSLFPVEEASDDF